MTDKEIKSAMEACLNRTDRCVCTIEDCPYAWEDECSIDLWKDALDLINRQQAEIDKLTDRNKRLGEGVGWLLNNENGIELIRAKAIKEFGERLKQEIDNALESNYKAKSQWLEKTNIDNETMVRYIDGKIDCLLGLNMFVHNLVKEMGADNGKT